MYRNCMKCTVCMHVYNYVCMFGRMPLCVHISAMTATTGTTRSDGCTRMSIATMCTIGEWATACRRCALELDS